MAHPTAEEIEKFLAKAHPGKGETPFRVEAVDTRSARVRLSTESQHLRPGQTVNGPTMFTLCDAIGWILVLHNLGFEAMTSVTSNVNINFLSRPPAGDLVGEGRLLKLGRRLAVSEISLFGEGNAEPVAHATVTYAIMQPKA